MGVDLIFGAVDSFFSAIERVLTKIWREIVKFARDVIGWFQGLNLQRGKDIPFVLDGKKLAQQIKKAPTYSTGEKLFSSNAPIMKGVLDSETDEIIHQETIEAGSLDDQTRDMMRHANRGLVVLGE